jgi:hypothetical protein
MHGNEKRTIESTIMDSIGSGVVYVSPEDCMTVGTGGRPAVLGVEVDSKEPSPLASLRIENRELVLFRKLLKDIRPRILRAMLGSLELEGP